MGLALRGIDAPRPPVSRASTELPGGGHAPFGPCSLPCSASPVLLLAGSPALRAMSAWHEEPSPSAARDPRRFLPRGHAHHHGGGRGHPRRGGPRARRGAQHGAGNSKVDFAAVEIASRLGLDTSAGSNSVRNVVAAIRRLDAGRECRSIRPQPRAAPAPPAAAGSSGTRTSTARSSLWNDGSFMQLVGQKGFHPVKISWEDIGRHENSVWGDRISDVGIWVRRDEGRPFERAARALGAPRRQLPRQGAGRARLGDQGPPAAAAGAPSRRRCPSGSPSWASPARAATAT